MKFGMKEHRNPFKSECFRGKGLRRGFLCQRGKFPTKFPRKFDNDWIPPSQNIIPLGKYVYSCQGNAVCKAEIEKVPFFNAPIYWNNRQQIGKIDEIFGNPRDYMVTIKLDEGINSSTFPLGETFFIDSMKLLPLERFLSKPKGSRGFKKWVPKFVGLNKNKKVGPKKRIFPRK